MITPKSNMTIIEGYLSLLENLNPKTKLDLISKLSATVKSGIITKKSTKLLVHSIPKNLPMS
jgi:hypothetical protein